MNEVLIPSEYVKLAKLWYDGSGSMLYAIASTGNLTMGNRRPIYPETYCPMSDDDWYKELWLRLEAELYRAMKTDAECELCEFYAWVEKVIQEL